MPKQTAEQDAITWEMLQTMLQTSYEGRKDSLGVLVDGAIGVCVSAVNRHGRAATLTIKLDFKSGEDGGMVDIYADVEAKVPKFKPTPVRLFGSKQGQLFSDDPEFVGTIPFKSPPSAATKKEE